MKKIILLYSIIIICFSCSTKKERIENRLMQCYYESLKDNGITFKKAINNYENLLVNEQILQNKSGDSYRELYIIIAKGESLKKAPSNFFLKRLKEYNITSDYKLQKECENNLYRDSLNYDFITFNKVNQVNLNARKEKDLKPSWVAKELLSVLSNEDFELNFYKLKVFTLLELTFGLRNNKRELAERPDENEKQEIIYKNPFSIHLKDKNTYLVNNEKVSISEMKKLLFIYLIENESNSIIKLNSERNVSYKPYTVVQTGILETIEKVRQKASKELFNTNFNNLTKNQKIEIKNKYPSRIMDEE